MVRLATTSGQTVSVDYATGDGTAKEPADYRETSGTVRFLPGQTSRTVTVPVAGDGLGEPDETFTVELFDPDNAPLGDSSGTGVIVNDEPAGACTIQGTDEDDVLRGTPGRDVICGEGGDDTIYGLAGNEILRGGDGYDAIGGGSGSDRIGGEGGDDTIYGVAGNDVLRGGGGDDSIRGGEGGDDIAGGAAVTGWSRATAYAVTTWPTGTGADTCSRDPDDEVRSC